jgi:hypothetical protein
MLLEKLTCSQLVKKFPAFYGTRKFITASTGARHLSLSDFVYKYQKPWQEKRLDGREGKLIGPFKSRFLYIGVGSAYVKGKEKVKMFGVGENERRVLQLRA